MIVVVIKLWSKLVRMTIGKSAKVHAADLSLYGLEHSSYLVCGLGVGVGVGVGVGAGGCGLGVGGVGVGGCGLGVDWNNRSLTALRRAGLQPTKLIDRTGSKIHESLLNSHLRGGQSSEVIRIRGAGSGASSIE